MKSFKDLPFSIFFPVHDIHIYNSKADVSLKELNRVWKRALYLMAPEMINTGMMT